MDLGRMGDPKKYRISDPNVTSEEIDEEVIIVNLISGNYYSAVDLAAYLWGRIQRCHDVHSMRRELLERFPEQSAAIDEDLSGFLAKLESEGLIRLAGGSEAPDQAVEPDKLVKVKIPESYGTPVLNCYSDMQDLLLLDPIHDVADVGWPTAKSDKNTQ
jgi:hypothetical protein